MKPRDRISVLVFCASSQCYRTLSTTSLWKIKQGLRDRKQTMHSFNQGKLLLHGCTRKELTNNLIWNRLDTEICMDGVINIAREMMNKQTDNPSQIHATNERRHSKKKKCRNAMYTSTTEVKISPNHPQLRKQIIPSSLNLSGCSSIPVNVVIIKADQIV